MKLMKWDLLWFLPVVAPALLFLGIFDAIEFYRYGRALLSSWRALGLLLSPSAYVWFTVSLWSVVLPVQTLRAIPSFFRPDLNGYKRRRRNSALAFLIAVVGVFAAWVIAWGSFPISNESDGIHMRMIPFIPWPNWSFF